MNHTETKAPASRLICIESSKQRVSSRFLHSTNRHINSEHETVNYNVLIATRERRVSSVSTFRAERCAHINRLKGRDLAADTQIVWEYQTSQRLIFRVSDNLAIYNGKKAPDKSAYINWNADKAAFPV